MGALEHGVVFLLRRSHRERHVERICKAVLELRGPGPVQLFILFIAGLQRVVADVCEFD